MMRRLAGGGPAAVELEQRAPAAGRPQPPPPERDADVILGYLDRVAVAVEELRRDLSPRRGGVDHFETLAWAAGAVADYVDPSGTYRGVAIFNLSDTRAFVGFSAGAGTSALRTLELEPRSWVTLPLRGNTVSIGGASAGAALVVPLSEPMPLAAGTLAAPGAADGSPIFVSPATGALFDVSDRTARALGRVSQGIADTLRVAGSVTAPGAGGLIANLAAPPAGAYIVRVYAGVMGAAAADVGNFRFDLNGVANWLTPLPAGANGASIETVIDRVTLDGVNPLAVRAAAVGTAGVEYAAQILATRIE